MHEEIKYALKVEIYVQIILRFRIIINNFKIRRFNTVMLAAIVNGDKPWFLILKAEHWIHILK